MARMKIMKKKASTLWEKTKLRRAKYPAVRQQSKSKARKRFSATQRLPATRGRPKTKRTPRSTMSGLTEPEVAPEVTPEIWFDVELQAEPPQQSTREELVASLLPMTPDMLTGEEFLTGWTSVVEGGTTIPSIVTTVTPLNVTAGVMQQLISTPDVQVTTIPVTIPLMNTAGAEPLSFQVNSGSRAMKPRKTVKEKKSLK